MEETRREVELSEDTLARVRTKAEAGCFMCTWALQSTTERRVLRDWPLGEDVEKTFPVEAQRYHILGEIRP